MPPFGRFHNILDYAITGLRRKFLKNCAVFTIFSLVVFLFASFQLINRALNELAAEILATAPDITVQQLSAGRQVSISLAGRDEVADIFGVQRVDERIWGYYFDPGSGANYTVVGLPGLLPGLGPQSSPGSDLAQLFTPAQPGRVAISPALREQLGLGERRFFSLYRPDLTLATFEAVVDFSSDTDLVTTDLILMQLHDARDLFALPEGLVTDLLVTVGNPLETDTIAAKIRERLPGVRVITRDQILKTYEVVFGWRSGLAGICLLTALVTFAILAWDKASGLSAEELREVGILKVLGWQTTDLIFLRFCESAVVAFAAFGCGYLLAWLHVVFGQGALFRPILLGWSVLRPSFPLAPSFRLGDLLVVLVLSVLPYLCATAVPAWRAAVVRADSVL